MGNTPSMSHPGQSLNRRQISTTLTRNLFFLVKSRNLRRITKSKRLRAVLRYHPEASSFVIHHISLLLTINRVVLIGRWFIWELRSLGINVGSALTKFPKFPINCAPDNKSIRGANFSLTILYILCYEQKRYEESDC